MARSFHALKLNDKLTGSHLELVIDIFYCYELNELNEIRITDSDVFLV